MLITRLAILLAPGAARNPEIPTTRRPITRGGLLFERAANGTAGTTVNNLDLRATQSRASGALLKAQQPRANNKGTAVSRPFGIRRDRNSETLFAKGKLFQ